MLPCTRKVEKMGGFEIRHRKKNQGEESWVSNSAIDFLYEFVY